MTPTVQFIQQLQALKEGERSRLRQLAGQPLDESLPGFDLFTGLWWPLRQLNQKAPRRETSWLVAKLYGAFPIPYVPSEGTTQALACVLGRCEPSDHDRDGKRRYRQRFDALLQSPLSNLEPHLRWALSVVADAIAAKKCSGLDWAQLLDELSAWHNGEEASHVRTCEKWASQYLDAAK